MIGNFVIYGDSYSTYKGYIPEGYEAWYNSEIKDCNDVCKVEECWWHQFFKEAPANLLFNCSYSGTTICNTGYNGEDCREKSFIARLDRLIDNEYFKKNKIDTLIIFGATNDCWAGSPRGEQKYYDWSEDDLYKVYPAFSYMLSRAKEAMGEGRVVFVLNHILIEDFDKNFSEACSHFGVEYLPLSEFHLGGGHPTTIGMKQIKDQIISYFENN